MPAIVSHASRPSFLRHLEASPAETQVLRVAARTAEDAGHLSGALRLVAGLPDGRESRRWAGQLTQALALDACDTAGAARWLVHPAARWSQERPAGAIFQHYAGLMLKTMGVDAAGRVLRAAAVACYDPVVVDAALFDSGLFADYVSGIEGSVLLDPAPEVALWSAQSSLVWQVEEAGAGVVVLRDLWEPREVRMVGAPVSQALAPGSLVYGRVVPVAGEPSFTFVLGPESIDQRCASRVLRARRQAGGPEERLRAIGHCRRRHTQPNGPRL